jgi:hypothetical protein
MGFLTTVILHNDAQGDFEKNPEQFGKAILAGIADANWKRVQVDVPFNGYCNYISVEPSRHADDFTVFVHYGNTVVNLNPYNDDFKAMMQRPEIAEDFLEAAERTIKSAREALNKAKKDKQKS